MRAATRAWRGLLAMTLLSVTSSAPAGAVEQRSIPTSATIHDLAFADDGATGVAVGTGGGAWRTTDGGRTWTALATGTTKDLHVVELHRASVWIAGDGGTLLRSSDTGTTWCPTMTGTTAPLHDLVTTLLETVAVGGGGTAIASVGEANCGSVFAPIPQADPTSADLHAAAWGDVLYIVGEDGTLLVSGDGGVLHRRDSTTSADLFGVDAAAYTPWPEEQEECGCDTKVEVRAVGEGGIVVSTADGTSFSTFNSGTTRTLRDITLRRNFSMLQSYAFAVGDAGSAVLIDYIPPGRRTLETGTSADLFAVDDPGAPQIDGRSTGVFAAGAGGLVLAEVGKRDNGTRQPPPSHNGGDAQRDDGSGYRLLAGDGGVFSFGDRNFQGSTGDLRLNSPIVAGATEPRSFDGYWLLASDGGVFAFNVPFFGSLGGESITTRAIDIEATPTGKGYWLALADGTVRSFGDARDFGDLRGQRRNAPIVAMASTSSGAGYYLLGRDGGVYTFGDAAFRGSTGDRALNAPIIDFAVVPSNDGYYLLGQDGGVFTFGSAPFHGSTGGVRLNAPVAAMGVARSATGYWLMASDGGIFTFGDLPFHGSTGGMWLNSPVLDLLP